MNANGKLNYGFYIIEISAKNVGSVPKEFVSLVTIMLTRENEMTIVFDRMAKGAFGRGTSMNFEAYT